MIHQTYKWAIKWRRINNIDGDVEQFMGEPYSGTLLFPTRGAAREHIKEKWGYIKEREDLRREPHGWRMPQAVKVRVTIEEVL